MTGTDGPQAPARILHVGLGNFMRAHLAWYTDCATDAAQWPITAFSGRSTELAAALDAQGGRYTLVTRGPVRDDFDTITSVRRAYAGADHASWLRSWRDEELACITLTVTEAAYRATPAGTLDLADPAVCADVALLREDLASVVQTVPGRLVAGLAARRAAGSGPVTVVPLDNLPDNGTVTARVVGGLADQVDPSLAEWIGTHVSWATSMVDRITPRPTAALAAEVATATGWADRCAVVTEPFSEWVLAGDFRGGRPDWEAAGVRMTDDVAPHEQRKLWLLNGGHSLLAYLGLGFGLRTVAEAVADERCRRALASWWAEAAPHLSLAPQEIADYQGALIERWENPRLEHRLAQIAIDGSLKLPVRVLPVLRLERRAGALPQGAVEILGSWIAYVHAASADLEDARSVELSAARAGGLAQSVPRLLALLGIELADDTELVSAVATAAVALRQGIR